MRGFIQDFRRSLIWIFILFSWFCTPAGAVDPPANVKWSGDFRLRYEGTFYQNQTPDRHRQRFRFGALYPVTPALEFGARVTTGSVSDSGSPYVTFGDLSNKDGVNLDRVYLRYRSAGVIDVVVGKFPNAFWQTEATWDGDAQPEGGVASFRMPGGSTARAGFYNISEQAFGSDSFMLGT